jgi:hypothetical protein
MKYALLYFDLDFLINLFLSLCSNQAKCLL